MSGEKNKEIKPVLTVCFLYLEGVSRYIWETGNSGVKECPII